MTLWLSFLLLAIQHCELASGFTAVHFSQSRSMGWGRQTNSKQHHVNHISGRRDSSDLTCLWSSSSSNNRDDEIARLEEQLRKLKEEDQAKQQQQQQQEGGVEAATQDTADDSPQAASQQRPSSSSSSTFATLTSIQKNKIFLDREAILSEKELLEAAIVNKDEGKGEEEGDNGMALSGGDFAKIGFAVLALVGLIAFAQVPIGRDNLVKYSATGASSIKGGQLDLGDLNTDIRR
ncbi:hypothetical protein ACA910_022422 [Epithemia clementina (nom. ined.)]